MQVTFQNAVSDSVASRVDPGNEWRGRIDTRGNVAASAGPGKVEQRDPIESRGRPKCGQTHQDY